MQKNDFHVHSRNCNEQYDNLRLMVVHGTEFKPSIIRTFYYVLTVTFYPFPTFLTVFGRSMEKIEDPTAATRTRRPHYILTPCSGVGRVWLGL